eukprot:Gregarina_sp_Pseudo_9__1763@NODE_219_length_3562_cov_43_099631_g204_i0_p1_GENE_NODE_219_length_3562_cov_43_099631_g204_i0NODE_219_length_3562_cov_43_099631_g204_i0_p1_ORF_typecomplete_len477_score76_75MBOAT/PF03062_19/21MBOAT/PF03062_19/3_5e36MBOAT_2/PF13813_6/3_9e03MBOAT_2/PF13813_6/0_00058_NODE_219_length_3562_cov_43_099631_g204_i020083438
MSSRSPAVVSTSPSPVAAVSTSPSPAAGTDVGDVSAECALRHRLHSPTSEASTSDGASAVSVSPSPRKRKLIVEIVERRPAPSILDVCDPDSRLSRSDFKGMVVLIHVLCGLYLVANPLYNMYENGYLIEPTLARALFEEFFILMAAWATCFTWAFTSYLLFKAMLTRRLSTRTVSLCQHITQAMLILGMISLIRWRRWAVFPSVFVLTVTLIHYMKMHSYVSCTKDLFENGTDYPGFPEACTLSNYFTYLLCPVLVYNITYPKCGHRFRVWYFIQKLIHLGGSLALIYTVSSQMVIPIFELSTQKSPLHVWARLVVPLLLMDFLFFYMMFECILNMLAEITDWGDRSYYDDWWNCTTWDDFARKWNKPVHEFLLCHVYVSTYRATKQSKFYASLSTFLFSALLHETVLATCLGVVRFWLFGLMMCQIPMMAFSRFHKHTTFGNYYFWFGLLVGVPFLSVLYARDWASVSGLSASV